MKHAFFQAASRALAVVGYRAARYRKMFQDAASTELRLSLLHSIGALRLRRTKADACFRFLQIGALELEGHVEPVVVARQFSDYRGILVDAQSIAVDRLREKYGDDEKIDIVHAAVTGDGKDVVLYSIDNTDGRYRRWVEGLSSLSKEHILKFRGQLAGVEDRIVETSVKGATIASILESRKIESLDLFMIDAEGYDYELLRQFPFEKVRPQIVFLEHAHLGADQRQAAIDFLIRHRYRIAILSEDILAENAEWDAPL